MKTTATMTEGYSQAPALISPPATAVNKTSSSASIVARGTNSERHGRNRSDTRRPRLLIEERPSHRGLFAPKPVECTRLRLVSGQTAAPHEAPLENGEGAKWGKPVSRLVSLTA